MYYVYIIRSKIDSDYYYVGFTKSIENRLANHNSGRTRSTKTYKPFELVYLEKYKTKSEAVLREKEFKRNRNLKRKTIERIVKDGPIV